MIAKVRWESVAVLLLVPVLAIAAYFRFTGLNWDDSHHLHPDERFLTIVASQLSVPENPLAYLRTSESTLNPYNLGQTFYVYGNLPMTLTRLLGEWAGAACSSAAGLLATGADAGLGESDVCTFAFSLTAYDGVQLLGRFLSGLLDLSSVLFIFLIGRRLYNWQAALLASLLQALAVLPIQQSHFFTMDNWAAAFSTMAIYASVRAAGLGDEVVRWRWRWWVLFGVALGLSVASRVNVAPLALVIGIAAAVWLARRGHTLGNLLSTAASRDLSRALAGITVAGVVALAFFRLSQPYAFADAALVEHLALEEGEQPVSSSEALLRSVITPNPQWLANMAEIQNLQAPEASFPPALQWTDRTPLLFPLTNMVLYGMGISAGLAAVASFLWALWRVVSFKRGWTAQPEWMVNAIPVLWSGLYFVFMGTRWVKSIRYFLPVYPTLFLLVAWALVTVWYGAAKRDKNRQWWRRGAAVALALLVVLPSLIWANSFLQIYRRPVTRVAASEWIFDNVPSGATLLYAASAGERELQLPLKEYEFQANGAGLPLNLNFTMPEDGVVHGVRLNYVSDDQQLDGNVGDHETLLVTLDPGASPSEHALALDQERSRVELALAPAALAAGSQHQLQLQTGQGGAISAGTSKFVNEHWDDLLPINTEGRLAYGAYYSEVTGGQRPVTNPDSPEKREELLNWLEEADYVALSSQRAVWHLPRLPLTYPLMIRYYEGLFEGELGFELVAQFHADLGVGPLHVSDTTGQISWGEPPNVGWPPPGDLAAEEAFSVYDHPPVWLFAKTASYSREKASEFLANVDLNQVTVMNPLEATRAPGGLLLGAEKLALQRANGTFSQLFDLDGLLSREPAAAAIVWWLTTVLLGWLVFPLTFVTMRGLQDRGYAVSRIAGLLLLSYFAWLAASQELLPYSRSTIVVGLLLLGVAAATVAWRRRRSMTLFLRQHGRYVVVVELIGLGLFLTMMAVRLGNPDVWDVIWGGEKPMDLSYFTAVLKSTTFPPYDPWFAGGYINYYYYGFVLVGALTKLLGVVPALAYNLILPMLFSFTGLGVFSITYNLVVSAAKPAGEVSAASGPRVAARATAGGMLALILAVALGNLAQLGVIVNAWYQTGTAALEANLSAFGPAARTLDGAVKLFTGAPAAIYTGDWFWLASRAINSNPGEVAPITEFPLFTFLYGDLHAHMISLPLTLLALAWAVSVALQPAGRREEGGDVGGDASRWEVAVQWAIGAVVLGSLRATNTWDLPTYLLLAVVALAFYGYRQRGRIDIKMILQTAYRTAGLVVLSILAFWPFAASYGTGYSSVSLWPGSYTQVSNYLSIHGLFLFLAVSFLFVEFRSWTRSWTIHGLQQLEPVAGLVGLALVLYLAFVALLFWRGYWIAPLVVTIMTAAGLLALRPGLAPARRVVLALLAGALGLTLIVEVFVLDGDIGRMNTVFKFYMQVWILLSIVAGAATVWVWQALPRSRTATGVWRVALAILIGLAALYPITAIKAKWEVRMSQDAPNTLDGMAFLPFAEYGDTDYANRSRIVRLAGDYEAIRWMQRNVPGSPVIAEAHSLNPYRSIGNRVSMYTGLPAIVGWDWHQRQQRAVVPGELVSHRIDDVTTLFNTDDIALAQSILERYGVGYVYVGVLEQTYYRPEGLAKFDRMAELGLLEPVYQEQGTSIYRVVEREEPSG